VATKQGLAAALHSGDPAYSPLATYFEERLGPVLQTLLQNAEAAGVIPGGVAAIDLLGTVANLCTPGAEDRARQMVALLLDGLRYRAASTPPAAADMNA